MAPNGERKTFRVRQIPHHVDKESLPSVLSRLLSCQKDTIRVASLAPSIDSYEIPPTKVATVVFSEWPSDLARDKHEWRKQNEFLPKAIIIDTHFKGFTVLNDVISSEHVADCFAISGLASHPFGSWKVRDGESDFMWLRDALPIRFSGVRSIIYGYDTHLLGSTSFQTIEDISTSFVTRLRSIGCSSPSAKPTIFIAHSLGGIVLKQAFVLMANSGAAEKHIVSQASQVILFGVPNKGMKINHLLPLVQGQPNKALVEQICSNSSYLETLDSQYEGISYLRGTRQVSIYETSLSQIPQETSPGQWKRDGPFQKLVEPDSALRTGLARENVSRLFAINKDHSNLVKFAEGDDDLHAVLGFFESPGVPVLSVASDAENMETSTGSTSGSLDDEPDFMSLLPTPDHEKLRQQWLSLVRSLKDSVFLSATYDRHERVESAHENTLDWAFAPHGAGLSEWFINDTSLFWINGKPGSGKSTLMKRICDDRSRYIPEHHINAVFFFNHRGTTIQKSYDGLLHCILHQIWSQSEELLGDELRFECQCLRSDEDGLRWTDAWGGRMSRWHLKVAEGWKEGKTTDMIEEEARKAMQEAEHRCTQKSLKRYLEKKEKDWMSKVQGELDLNMNALEKRLRQHRQWTTDRLEQAFLRILNNRVSDVKVFLFLDALDEYEGEPEMIAQFLVKAVEHAENVGNQIKICFSSRPWNVFKDFFGNAPSLIVESYTQADIAKYVQGRLVGHKRAAELLESPDPSQRRGMFDLKERLLDRAEGVFLWVRLMLDTLLDQLQDGASMKHLKELQAALPTELEKLYVALLGRIKPDFRQECYIMLEILLRSDRTLSVYEFWDAEQCALGGPRKTNYHTCGLWPKYDVDVDTVARRVRSRCGGLIELSGPDKKSMQLMHQTVREFLLRPDSRKHLLHPEDDLFSLNGHYFLAQYYLTALKQYSLRDGQFRVSKGNIIHRIEWLDECAYHGKQSEFSTGRSLLPLLEQFEDREIADLVGYLPHSMKNRPTGKLADSEAPKHLFEADSTLAFAVLGDFQLCVRQMLVGASRQAQELGSLLHRIIRRQRGKVREAKLDTFDQPKKNLSQMMQLLLNFGADPGTILSDKTPLQVLFEVVGPKSIPAYACLLSENPRAIDPELYSMARMLLESPLANPNLSLYIARTGNSNARQYMCNPLHIAAYNLSEDLLLLLLRRGAKANCSDSFKQTPLDVICLSATIRSEQRWTAVSDCVQPLLRHGGHCFNASASAALADFCKEGNLNVPIAFEDTESYSVVAHSFASDDFEMVRRPTNISLEVASEVVAFSNHQSSAHGGGEVRHQAERTALDNITPKDIADQETEKGLRGRLKGLFYARR